MHGWELIAAVVFGVLVLGFSILAAGLGRVLVTAPLVFVVIGAVIGFTVGPVDTEQVLAVKLVAEATLALVLFHDAAAVKPRELGTERSGVLRLLLIAFPLTVLIGWGSAVLLFGGMSVMMALLLAVALAPTDAGLGAPTILNPVVPTRVRRLLNVESGLNDGLATPVVLFAVAAIAGSGGLAGGANVVEAIVAIALGMVVGAVVGAVGGLLISWSNRRGVSTTDGRALAALMLPLMAYAGAELVSANAFVAAFIAGTAFAGSARGLPQHRTLQLTEDLANPLGYLVWLVFGLAGVPLIWRALGWREVVFALLALTVFRMLPVALSLLGTGLKPPTVAFIGWFGPRGLASIVFALIALETLEPDEDLRRVLVTISLTVVLSVVAHGFSAEPLAERYGAWVQRTQPAEELQESTDPHTRDSRLRRTRHGTMVP